MQTFQDLGELTQIVRTPEGTGPSGVETLLPDEPANHGEALEEIRAVIDEYYSESLDRLADENERVVVERLVVPSNDLPHIEYKIVDEVEE